MRWPRRCILYFIGFIVLKYVVKLAGGIVIAQLHQHKRWLSARRVSRYRENRNLITVSSGFQTIHENGDP